MEGILAEIFLTDNAIRQGVAVLELHGAVGDLLSVLVHPWQAGDGRRNLILVVLAVEGHDQVLRRVSVVRLDGGPSCPVVAALLDEEADLPIVPRAVRIWAGAVGVAMVPFPSFGHGQVLHLEAVGVGVVVVSAGDCFRRGEGRALLRIIVRIVPVYLVLYQPVSHLCLHDAVHQANIRLSRRNNREIFEALPLLLRNGTKDFLVERRSRSKKITGLAANILCKELICVSPGSFLLASHLEFKGHGDFEAEVVLRNGVAVLLGPVFGEGDVRLDGIDQLAKIDFPVVIRRGIRGLLHRARAPRVIPRHLFFYDVDPRHAVGRVLLQLCVIRTGNGIGPDVTLFIFNWLREGVAFLWQLLLANGVVLIGLRICLAVELDG